MHRIDASTHTINGALEFHDFTDVDGVNFYHPQLENNLIVGGSDQDQNPDVHFDCDHHNLISGCSSLIMGDDYKIFGPTTPPAADMFAPPFSNANNNYIGAAGCDTPSIVLNSAFMLPSFISGCSSLIMGDHNKIFDPPPAADMFSPFSNANNNHIPAAGCDTPSIVLNNAFMLPSFEGGLVMKEGPDKEVVNNNNNNNDIGEVSSGSRAKTKSYVRTSRALYSERWRRGRMKEKLYELRDLVPNVTKMDKASIVGDASQYMKELQMQAKQIKDEIADLEASLVGPDDHGSMQNIRKIQMENTNQPNSKKMIQVNLFQVDEREFYVKLVCEKGVGVPASLYKVLESLTIFNVHNSNLVTAFESYVLTTKLNVNECNQEHNVPNLRCRLIEALLNQGFELVQSAFSS